MLSQWDIGISERVLASCSQKYRLAAGSTLKGYFASKSILRKKKDLWLLRSATFIYTFHWITPTFWEKKLIIPLKEKSQVFTKFDILERLPNAHAVKFVQTVFEISFQNVSNLHLKVVDFTFLAETVHVSSYPKRFKSAPSILDFGIKISL